MASLLTALIAAGMLPLMLAFWAHRRTSLCHAVVWTAIAWLSWGLVFLCEGLESARTEPGRYGALCLTGCAGVAVLGARRPHVFAWNFVVLGLFAVMLLPMVETQVIGTRSLDGMRIVFLAGTIAVGILNYLPTRLGFAAILLLLACSGEVVVLIAPTSLPESTPCDLLLTMTPWLAWLCLMRREAHGSEFDRLWLGFRDCWGMVWSQRVREQFNHAAQNAGWPITLTWHGLSVEKKEPAEEVKYVATLRNVLQRFLAADQNL